MPWAAPLLGAAGGGAAAGGAATAAGAAAGAGAATTLGAGAAAAGGAAAGGSLLGTIGSGLASAGSAIGSGLGAAGSAIGSAGSAIGTGIANAGYGLGDLAGGAVDAIAGGGVHATGGGALSSLPSAPAAGMSAGPAPSGGLLSSNILAPNVGGTSHVANSVSGLSAGGTPAPMAPAIHNPFGLGAADAPTWGQRTFGNNMIGQGIDETIAMVDPRVSSPQLADARMGVLKSFAGDQLKSGMKDQMNFAPAPAMPQRQAPQQQQGNNVNPYTVNSLNRLNRRLNPLGGGL